MGVPRKKLEHLILFRAAEAVLSLHGLAELMRARGKKKKKGPSPKREPPGPNNGDSEVYVIKFGASVG